MIARPQADLLNMLPVTQVTPLAAKAMEGGASPRFDAALLEAAKTVRDSAPQAPEQTLVPKVRQALENALSELVQKPVDQLKQLAAQPKNASPEIAAIVDRVAQAAGLNADESSALKDLVSLALPRVLAVKAEITVPGTPAENAKTGGVQPGPQGGTPVTTTAPADSFFGSDPNAQPDGPAPAPRKAQDADGPLGALQQALAAPVYVSTRTDDGSNSAGLVTLSRNDSPAPVAGPVAAVGAPQSAPQTQEPRQAPGRVIQVSTAQDPATGVKPAGVPTPPANLVPDAPAAAPAATQGPSKPQAVAQAPVQDLDPVPAPPAQAEAVPQGPAPEAPAQPVQAKQPAGVKDAPVQAGAKPVLDFQIQDPAQPLAIVPGSELTLQEDGTWRQPAASTPAPQAAAPQGPAQPTDAPVFAPAFTPQASQAASLPQALPAPVTVPAPVVAAQAPVQANGAPLPAAPQAGVQPLAPQVAQTVPVQVPAAPAQPNKVEPKAADAKADPAGSVEAADAFQAPATADSVQSRRTAGDSAFGNLAQFSQDPVKALAQQTARDYAVRESVFKQVSEALREAPDTDNGRMLIRLKPAELGEVHVDLVMVGGKLSARLVASQPEVRDAFVRDLHAFKAGLESQGVAVRDISVAVRAGVADQQQQQPRQQDPQTWWRELPREIQEPPATVPANTGYTAGGGTIDQRFSALA